VAKVKKLPKLWRKPGRGGKLTGNYICKVNGTEVNLRTKILDGDDGAIERSKQAQNGRRSWPSDADKAAVQLETVTPAPSSPPASVTFKAGDTVTATGTSEPGGTPPPPVHPDAVIPPPAAPPAQPMRLLTPVPNEQETEEAATVAAAEETAGGASDAPEPSPAPLLEEPSVDELAELGVGAQVWLAAEYARRKVYRQFPTPQLPDEGKKQLAAQWKKILEYSGAAHLLPPWVTGLVIPGVVLLMTTQAMAQVFSEQAKEMKRQADGAGAAPPARPDIPVAA